MEERLTVRSQHGLVAQVSQHVEVGGSDFPATFPAKVGVDSASLPENLPFSISVFQISVQSSLRSISKNHRE